MKDRLLRSTGIFTLMMGLAGLPLHTVYAQEAEETALDEAEEDMETMVVTGSLIARDGFDSASPLSVFSREDLAAQGQTTLSDFLVRLPSNIGSEFNADETTQGATTGTSNINLRNLGLNATLVLLNGRRQALTAVASNDGSTFVDTNSLIPRIMLERLEIVKDGGSAIYGSDAVAGTVNFITRDDFEGFEFTYRYDRIPDNDSLVADVESLPDQRNHLIEGIFGTGTDNSHITVAFSYFDQSELPRFARDFSTAGSGTSGFGQPGTFIPTQGELAGQFVEDPDCANVPGGIPGAGIGGGCGFQFATFFQIVPRTERLQGYSTFRHEVDRAAEFYGEFGFTRIRTERGNSPSFPVVTDQVIVPAENPGNVFGVPAVWLGRPLGGLPNETRNDVRGFFDSDTWRFVGGVRGEFFDSWRYDLSYTFSENNFDLNVPDTLSDNFFNSINGFGGFDCPGEASGVAPGTEGCLFFNPFGNAALAAPGDPQFNSDEVIDFISGRALSFNESELQTIDAVVSGELFDLPAGAVGLAVGYQFRFESISGDVNDNNMDEEFLFLFGAQPFAGQRSTHAVFAEARVPLLANKPFAYNLELQLAGRFETSDATEEATTTTDPKFSVLWQPNQDISVRASFSQSFQVPTLFQAFGQDTTLTGLIDPLNPGNIVFRPVIAEGNPDLVPQEADTLNFGVTWEPSEGFLEGLRLAVDYWDVEYENIIVQQNAQTLLFTDPLGPNIIRTEGIDGGPGTVSRIEIDFVNAAFLEASGIDIEAGYSWDTDFGFFDINTAVAYFREFELQDPDTGEIIDAAGQRNFTNFARSLPRWRINSVLTWNYDIHTFNAVLRWTDGYEDENQPVGSEFFEIDDHFTVDFAYTVQLPSFTDRFDSPLIKLGVINATDNAPPFVFSDIGFDGVVHDPRGRIVYAEITQRF